MSKLTKAQLEVLAENEILSVSIITRNVWGTDGRFSIKVKRATFDALVRAGMYLPHRQNAQTIFYARTMAGRKALEDVAIKAKTAAVRAKHLGIHKPSQWKSMGFAKRPAQRSASRPIIRRSDQ